ncbi:MAG: type II toxin-antitoxin system prevent-host-death family antitoxin [Micrococcales bacterium]|nr:type II toxin-antitoxin system prevent-host-death family antitoxin [Micrococcales bacterium]
MSAAEVIPQRQLRNDISGVLRRVASGHAYVITVNGQPVATLAPVDEPRYVRLRPVGELRTIERVTSAVPTGATLEELRGDRV